MKKTWHHSYSTYKRRENTMTMRELVIQTTTTRPLSTMVGRCDWSGRAMETVATPGGEDTGIQGLLPIPAVGGGNSRP